MLSEAARPYIQASVPVLREQGLAITRHFYTQMFAAHPELNNLFNLGNQANGVQQQSLAAAVFAYAANIDNPDALAPVAKRIAHKHAAVGLRAEHYPIVGHHLLGAIQHVLGEAATPELLAAWSEAYWLLANQLIEAEAALYEAAGSTGQTLFPLQVMETRREGNGAISYYLQTPDGTSPGPFQPGQYISVAVDFPEENLRQLRQYSLSDSTEKPWWRITVKREDGDADTPAGRVSSWLHRNLRQGGTVMASKAFGDFTPSLAGETPLVLLSAGVGVTPMVSILNTLIDRHPARPVVFAHAARDGRQHALRDDLRNARSQLNSLTTAIFYEAPQADEQPGIDYDHAGRMDLARVLDATHDQADFLLCGPIGFMQAQRQALLERGIDPQRIHREVFGPDLLDHLL